MRCWRARWSKARRMVALETPSFLLASSTLTQPVRVTSSRTALSRSGWFTRSPSSTGSRSSARPCCSHACVASAASPSSRWSTLEALRVHEYSGAERAQTIVTSVSSTFREHSHDPPRVVLGGRRRRIPRRGGGHPADGLGPCRSPRDRTAVPAPCARRARRGGRLRNLLVHGTGVCGPAGGRRSRADRRVARERTPAGPRLRPSRRDLALGDHHRGDRGARALRPETTEHGDHGGCRRTRRRSGRTVGSRRRRRALRGADALRYDDAGAAAGLPRGEHRAGCWTGARGPRCRPRDPRPGRGCRPGDVPRPWVDHRAGQRGRAQVARVGPGLDRELPGDGVPARSYQHHLGRARGLGLRRGARRTTGTGPRHRRSLRAWRPRPDGRSGPGPPTLPKPCQRGRAQPRRATQPDAFDHPGVSTGCVLAVDIGGTSIKAEILDAGRTPRASASTLTPSGGRAALAAVIDLGRRLLHSLPPPVDVARVGLAVPGVVDLDRGVGVLAANLAWRDLPVSAPVSAALGLPVTMVHDVTAAGVGEWRCGAGRGVDDLVVVVIGTGIAATLITGGVVVRGGLGQAGELGHVVVRPGGRRCACGRRGCLEAISSARATAHAHAARSGRPVDGAIEVFARLGLDAVADEVCQEASDALADGLLIVCALLGPSRIVVGGGLAGAGEALLAPVRSRLERTSGLEAVPPVVAAQLGSRAGVIGAALAALDAGSAA